MLLLQEMKTIAAYGDRLIVSKSAILQTVLKLRLSDMVILLSADSSCVALLELISAGQSSKACPCTLKVVYYIMQESVLILGLEPSLISRTTTRA